MKDDEPSFHPTPNYENRYKCPHIAKFIFQTEEGLRLT